MVQNNSNLFEDKVKVESYIFQQFRLGKSKKEVINDLIDMGILPEVSKEIVDAARIEYKYQLNQSNFTKLEKSKRGLKKMFVGLFWLVLGGVVTGVTYFSSANNPGGGSYVIYYGAIIFGAIYFILGLAEWLSSS